MSWHDIRMDYVLGLCIRINNGYAYRSLHLTEKALWRHRQWSRDARQKSREAAAQAGEWG